MKMAASQNMVKAKLYVREVSLPQRFGDEKIKIKKFFIQVTL